MKARRGVSRLALQREAESHERAGRLEKAIESWLALLKVAPRAETHNRVGDLLDKLGRADEASRQWCACAERYRADGFFHKAVAMLRKASRRDPKDVSLLRQIADLHVTIGNVVEAKRLFVEVAERWLEQNRSEAALEALETLVAVDDDANARRMLARLHEQHGDAARAAAHQLALAQGLIAEGRLSDARELLERAHALAPKSRPVRVGLSDVYVALQVWDRAVPLLEALAEEKGADARVLLRLAEAQVANGRVDAARAAYRRLLKRQPRDDEARVRLGLLWLEEPVPDPDRAFAELLPVVERFLERGDARRAASVLEDVVRRAEGHVRSLLRLGAIYNKLGDRDALERTYDRIVEAHRQRGDAALEQAALEARQALAAPRPAPAPPAAVVAAAGDAEAAVEQAAERIRSASALLVAAGAGMNVDFGWPDYRDREGFQQAFPAYRALGFGFEDLARPSRFELDPGLAWGFYAQRLEAARRRVPHPGFAVLSRWRSLAPGGGFVVTSCVEGEFQRAGFDPQRMVESVGSIEWLQCARECGAAPVPAPARLVEVDPETLRAREPFPTCAGCGALARPNVLLFGDWAWDMSRVTAQDEALRGWLSRARGLVVVECGETPRLPALRNYVRRLAQDAKAQVVRISTEDAGVPEGGVCVPLRPREAFERINRLLRGA